MHKQEHQFFGYSVPCYMDEMGKG